MIFRKGLTDGLFDTKLTAKKKYFINFTEKQKSSVRFHHNGMNTYIFFNTVEIYKLKPKYSQIDAAPICLGNLSKTF